MLLESNDEDIKHTSRGSNNHNNFFVIFVGIALKLEKIGFIHVRPRNPWQQMTGKSFNTWIKS